jgi:hypothetical protein
MPNRSDSRNAVDIANGEHYDPGNWMTVGGDNVPCCLIGSVSQSWQLRDYRANLMRISDNTDRHLRTVDAPEHYVTHARYYRLAEPESEL